MKTQRKLLEAIEAAKAWAFENLDKAEVYCPALKSNVKITKNGIRHGIRYKSNLAKVSIIYNLLSAIRHAKLSNIPLKKPLKKGELAVYQMYNFHTFEGERYKIYLIIKKRKDGAYYYDSGILEKMGQEKKGVGRLREGATCTDICYPIPSKCKVKPKKRKMKKKKERASDAYGRA